MRLPENTVFTLVHPKQVSEWKRQVIESLSEIFAGGFMSATYPIPKFYFQICQHRSAFSGVTIPLNKILSRATLRPLIADSGVFDCAKVFHHNGIFTSYKGTREITRNATLMSTT